MAESRTAKPCSGDTGKREVRLGFQGASQTPNDIPINKRLVTYMLLRQNGLKLLHTEKNKINQK